MAAPPGRSNGDAAANRAHPINATTAATATQMANRDRSERGEDLSAAALLESMMHPRQQVAPSSPQRHHEQPSHRRVAMVGAQSGYRDPTRPDRVHG